MKIKAAVVQMRIKVGEPEKNLETGLNFLKNAALFGAKLIVMPEMWVTGLYPEVTDSPFVERTEEIVGRVSAIAKGSGAAIVAGSLGWRRPGSSDRRVFNRLFVVSSDGSVAGSYDKIQVFRKNREDLYTIPGTRVNVIETLVDGAGVVRIAPFICFDLRFPELFRMASFAGAELITVSSQFPTSRINHWRAMMPARAVENQCHVLASNVCGHDGLLALGGHSMIVDHNGEALADCRDAEGVGFADIDLDAVRDYRSKFQFIGEAVVKGEMAALAGRDLG